MLKLLICLFLILITFVAFWQVRNNEFINLDDDLYVTHNPHVQGGLTLKGILWAFTSTYAGHWHPMTWLSHMIDYDLYGLNPGGHHLTNLFFHVANTLLLFLLLLRMTGAPWRSSFVAALFALHPLHVESVAWVSERKDVLSTFFWMLAIGAYISYVARPKLNRYLLVVLCFILALMSKSMAVTLPFVLLLLDYWPLGGPNLKKMGPDLNLSISKSANIDHRRVPLLRLILEKIPLFFLTAVSSLFTILAYWKGGTIASLAKLPLEIRIGNALVSYVRYIAKMIWPDRLAVLYPHPIILPLWEAAGAAFLLTILTVWMIIAGRRRPYYVVGWLWYLVTLLPTIGLVQAGVQAMADRFTYIPLIGLFIMVAYGVPDILTGWRYQRVALVTSGGFLLSILMICTMLQVQRWQNSVRLFSHTLDVTVNNALIHNNLGVTLVRQGKDQEAIAHYKKALEINPRYVDAHYNLGSLLVLQGMDQEALPHYIEVLRINPRDAVAHYELAVILARQNKAQEAIVHLAEAVRIIPNYGEAHFTLGMIYLKMGKKDLALTEYKTLQKINTNLANTLYQNISKH